MVQLLSVQHNIPYNYVFISMLLFNILLIYNISLTEKISYFKTVVQLYGGGGGWLVLSEKYVL